MKQIDENEAAIIQQMINETKGVRYYHSPKGEVFEISTSADNIKAKESALTKAGASVSSRSESLVVMIIPGGFWKNPYQEK